MRSNTSEMAVVLRANERQEAPGVVRLLEWGKRDRLKRALKALALCWGAAVGSVLIPLVHFILPPLLLIAGPIVAYVIYHRERIIDGGKGTCPNCSEPFSIVKGAVKWPLKDLCPACQTPVQVEPART